MEGLAAAQNIWNVHAQSGRSQSGKAFTFEQFKLVQKEKGDTCPHSHISRRGEGGVYDRQGATRTWWFGSKSILRKEHMAREQEPLDKGLGTGIRRLSGSPNPPCHIRVTTCRETRLQRVKRWWDIFCGLYFCQSLLGWSPRGACLIWKIISN